jgi:WD40 repeat protein
VTVPKKNKAILFQIWNANTGELLGTVPRTKKQKPIISFKWHPNNTMIAATDGIKKNIHVWNYRGEHLMELSNTSMPMQFSKDGRLLATGGVLANSKTDTGYIWEFFITPPPERIGQNFVTR